MIIRKITIARIVQVIDTERGIFTCQGIIPTKEVSYENDKGEQIEPPPEAKNFIPLSILEFLK